MTEADFHAVRFDADTIARYDGRGPRYTSYPTALQFDERFAASEHREHAIQSNAAGRPLSLYVHIPFCRSLCYYCGCNKVVTRNQARVNHYLDNLHREIAMQSELFATERKVEQLHLGGGTPTYLDDTQLAGLLGKLATSFSFASAETRQFSIEVDPRTVSESSIGLLADLGFNRLSLGIQDFDSAVQIAVNRVQRVTDVARLVDSARDHRFRSISFDLIYGLPRQTMRSFDRTLQSAIDLRPERLAVYNYAHLPQRFKGQRMINARELPPAATKLDILKMTIERLCSAGYDYVGMDHFALPGDDLVRARRNRTLQRNFQGYSTHKQCDLLGLGASSISHIGNSYSQNAVTTMEYEALIAKNELPVRRGLLVDDDDLIRADVIQELMCYDGLSYAQMNARHGFDFEDYFRAEIAQLAPLVGDELVELSAGGIHVTPLGRLLMRNIAMTFDRHLDRPAAGERFSRAI